MPKEEIQRKPDIETHMQGVLHTHFPAGYLKRILTGLRIASNENAAAILLRGRLKREAPTRELMVRPGPAPPTG